MLATVPMSTRTIDKPDWVLAAPFRAHVSQLMEVAQVPWQVIAYQAGVPLATLRTLLFGRHGRVRTKITQSAAVQLIETAAEDLAWMKLTHISADKAATRIRLLRSHEISWEQIADLLNLSKDICQAIAWGECTSCSVMVDILTQSACDSFGFDPWDAENGESSESHVAKGGDA